jgi:hypothetical protein
MQLAAPRLHVCIIVETAARFDEPERMELAVRALAERGIVREHIVVEPLRERGAPPSLDGPSHRQQGTGIGSSLGMLIGFVVSGAPGGDPVAALFLILLCGGSGALLGGVIGLIVGGIRKRRWRPARDWLVRVEAASRDELERAAGVLRASGGSMVEG